jgi:hypothetical protein
MSRLAVKTLGNMFVLYHLEDEVRRSSRSHCGPQNPIMVRVSKYLIQLQLWDLSLHWGQQIQQYRT